MRGVLWISCALAMAAVVGCPAGRAATIDLPQFTVTGEGTVSVAPDSASLRAGVISEGKTAQDASFANAGAMSAVMTVIKEVGIAAKDVQTFRYVVRPVYGDNRPVRERIIGFQASNSVVLTIRDLDRIGVLIDRLVAAGANDMGGVEFVVTDSSKALDPARAEAFADARRKAELYAKTAGVRLGAPLTITEQVSVPSRYYPVLMQARAAPPPTPVATGEQSLQVSVTVSFELLR